LTKQSYAQAGVDIHRAEAFVERLKLNAKRQGHKKLWPALGGYAAILELSTTSGMAFTTDGVGTKLLVAHELKKYDTIGIDLVAMCANDLICVGAKPEIFLDYYAVGQLEDNQADQIMTGIIEGCDQTGMLLIGGETAELPGLYEPGHYDLAGFAAGRVESHHLMSADKIKPGQSLIGVSSSGIHSNGFSLARRVLGTKEEYLKELLKPTALYVNAVNEVQSTLTASLTGMAHITGGGWRNLLRLNENVGYYIEDPLPVPDIFKTIGKEVELLEMYKTFNMGLGLALIVQDNVEQVISILKSNGHHAKKIGVVTDKAMSIECKGLPFKLGE
jgi:phosphoribosylformylglycinamidine cyclo-ligase